MIKLENGVEVKKGITDKVICIKYKGKEVMISQTVLLNFINNTIDQQIEIEMIMIDNAVKNGGV